MIDSLIFPATNIKLSHAFAHLCTYAMGCGTSGTSATYVAHADPLDPVDAVDVDDLPAVNVDAPLAVDVPGKAEMAPAVQGWLLETLPGTWEATVGAILMAVW